MVKMALEKHEGNSEWAMKKMNVPNFIFCTSTKMAVFSKQNKSLITNRVDLSTSSGHN